ncbi:carbohydrate ABC transporter permease [Paraburkholderia kururiensis]|uniref:Sugar ABC transporter permease n=1 Tax=Paraburkholderia kururiensis TaxID=984307 RepID=A0ABZ0WLH2_9BURK|nr:sugar ABC transporter permease [Paraburkholderia kururiensis]WQD78194.1 sugar ABC transporter permease [Paraburkholderia kururiensis]
MFNRGKTSLPFVFLVPPLVVMAVLGLVPTVAAINLALKNRVLRYTDSEYVWFRNFVRLATDRRFINSIEVSAIWEVVTVLGAVAVGIVIAVYLFENVRGRMRNLIGVLLIVPVLLPRVSAAFIWKFMYSPLSGILSWLFGVFGIPNTAFLSDPSMALYAVALVDIWQWGLFFAVVVLKLLETLPPEPLEAARLDYAKTWQVYAWIALPMLRAPIMSLVFIKMVESLRSFDLIYVMTKGGPGVSTETLDMYAYSQGIGLSGKVSYASSMAVLMMVATTLIFTLIWKRVSKWED